MSKHLRGVASRCAAALLLALVWTPGEAQEKVSIGYASITLNFSPLWVAKEKGLFEKNGLTADLKYLAGTTVVQALLAGDVAVAGTNGATVAAANLKGGDLVIFLGILNRTNFYVMAAPEISSPQALAGKWIGVTRFGSASDAAARFVVAKLGLPGVTILQMGGDEEMMMSMSQKAIQAGILSGPWAKLAEKNGFKPLVSLTELGYTTQFTSLATSRKWLTGKPDVIRRIARAVSEGIHYVLNNKKETVDIGVTYTRVADRKILEEAYDELHGILQRIPSPTLAGVRADIEYVMSRAPGARPIPAEQMVEPRFVRELEESGFFRSLQR